MANPIAEINQGRELISPFARITLGNGDKFTWGDGYLKSVSITLSEGENASGCSFSIYDPGRKFADKYFSYIESVKGLTALPSSQNQSSGSANNSNNASSGVTADGTISPRMRAMLDSLAWAEGSINYGNQNGYNVLFGGRTFNGYADRPNVDGAAGRYQFLRGSWADAKAGAKVPDFTPQSQDKAAVWSIVTKRGAGSQVESGNIEAAVALLRNEWTSLPGAAEQRYTMPQFIEYYNRALAKYQPGAQQSAAASTSAKTTATPPAQTPTPVKAQTGSQITVELGFNGQVIAAYSFIHTSLNFDLFSPDTLVFGGTAAIWVLTQRRKNTAYINLTFRQIAKKIADSYGLKLVMPVEGPTYEYFPQRGKSDYEALLIEARRIGYRIYSKGNQLIIQPRSNDVSAFFIALGENLGTSFTVSHQAYTEQSSGGSNATWLKGQRKVVADIDSGQQKVVNSEDTYGKGKSANLSVSGKSVEENKPKTTGKTDESDRVRREGEAISEISFNAGLPTTPEALLVDPDQPIATQGISKTIDRYWIARTITHKLDDSGFLTTISGYSPLRFAVKSSNTPGAAGSNSTPPPLNPNGFIRPTDGNDGSPFGSRGGRHRGLDIPAYQGTTVVASADGVVVDTENICTEGDQSCGGGFGNLVYINHANGIQTRYAHLVTGSVTVQVGQQVKQGQAIGKVGNTGRSTGPHLHFEILENGIHVNPLKHIPARP